MIPLTMAKPGETVTVRRITGKDDVRQHLAELGFVVDTEVTVVSSLAGGLIVQTAVSPWTSPWLPGSCSEKRKRG